MFARYDKSMTKRILLLAAALPSLASAEPADTTAALRDAALGDEVAWDITEGLTTEIGQRLAGTAEEARARAWAVARLRALGFADPRIETFAMPVWVRGAETAEIVAPFPQRLVLAALGGSGATPPTGLTAELVRFDSLAALEAAPDAAVRGKIVYVTHAMTPTQDGSQYGVYGDVRRKAPAIASRKGAAAILIRSIGTDHHRNPHTGATNWGTGATPSPNGGGATPIPAAALALPDAEQLDRIVGRGRPVTMKLVLTPHLTPNGQSGNVIAEVPGRDPRLPIVVVGCHLDSWDLGTGAIDDAAGCGIVTAAAKRILDSPSRPLRTIRVVWFGAEEPGLLGGIAYRQRHGDEPHGVVAESDFGADRVWRLRTNFVASAAPVGEALARALPPLGIAYDREGKASGGSDLSVMGAAGSPSVDLDQDGIRYFDLHHTPDDTLDKIDPAQLRQNVAAWTATLSIVANAAAALGPVPAGTSE